ncbi:MAG: MFS transporter [Alphaproteobacteria bacterium]|nr:MFS transporter [Alphaproteobacteria bacterium]MBV9694424.1 MFS transporter [Alphaproteobacteria bacterium]
MTGNEDTTARFRWLPPGLRPKVAMNLRQERVFLLVGIAALFAGYDMSIYGLAVPRIQASLHIPEDQVGLTITYFRLASIVAMPIVAMADLIGRRRVLLITILGQGVLTLATAFAGDYTQFVGLQIATRIFGYCEEMLVFVAIAEEVAAAARGWSNGTLSAMYYTGIGVASLCYAAVTILPGDWRALYAIGSVPILLVAYLRRQLPETQRFEIRGEQIHKLSSRAVAMRDLLRRLVQEYPRRLTAILICAGAFGFATAPVFVLSAKYIQSTLGYKPYETTMLLIGGGLIGLAMSVLTGRLSDRLGRRAVLFATLTLALVGYGVFYSGARGAEAAGIWMVANFAYIASDAMIAGFAVEIMPTAYRATVGGLRYLVQIGAGAASLALEGLAYDHFGAHGPAMLVMLAAMPIALIALLFLPEPAGRALEDVSHG